MEARFPLFVGLVDGKLQVGRLDRQSVVNRNERLMESSAGNIVDGIVARGIRYL